MALTTKLKTYVENLLSLIAQPPVLQNPIAYNNSPSIPPQDSTTKASLNQGFPPIQMQPLASGGLPVQESEMNGLFYYLSQYACFQSQGGQYTYDPNNTAGYSQGAILWCASAGRFLISLKNNNTANFIQQPNYINDGINWNYASFQTLVESVVNTNKILTVLAQLQTTKGIVDSGGITTTGNFASKSITDNGVLTFNQRPNFNNSQGATIDDFSQYFYLINLQDIELGVYSKLFPNQNLPAFPALVSQQLQVFNVVTGRVKFLQYPYTSGALFEMQLSYYIGDIINNGNFILQFQAFNTATSKLQNSVYNVFSLRYNTYNTTTGTTQFLIDVISDPSNPTKNWATGGSHPFSQIQFRVYETSSGAQSGRIELTIQASLT